MHAEASTENQESFKRIVTSYTQRSLVCRAEVPRGAGTSLQSLPGGVHTRDCQAWRLQQVCRDACHHDCQHGPLHQPVHCGTEADSSQGNLASRMCMCMGLDLLHCQGIVINVHISRLRYMYMACARNALCTPRHANAAGVTAYMNNCETFLCRILLGQDTPQRMVSSGQQMRHVGLWPSWPPARSLVGLVYQCPRAVLDVEQAAFTVRVASPVRVRSPCCL